MCNKRGKGKEERVKGKEERGRQTGQTLLELVIVISVSVIVIGALVFATIASLRNASFSKNQSQATKLAQEGIEKVRVARDRNNIINISSTAVRSWNGSGSGDAIWDYHITGNSAAFCETVQPPNISGKCYFNLSSDGSLQNIGFASATFPVTAESIPPSPPSIFQRVVTLSDGDDWQYAKQVSVIVQWTDFAGVHESRLTTILRKL